ncbi:zinc finger cchc-type superfamily [Holotrichia oblita]|uniref:Zinc finger cchc-type superfamily n=1 Tax=Holotrichia oblita TaxID=644536 RepID=A0ACB9TNM9_HOLOL|nr:zinc finger cchc-type superfamily [Holotrichia oblita]
MSSNTSTDVLLGTSIAGGDLFQSNDRTVDDLTMNNNNSTQYFANVLKSGAGAKFSFPERDQAVIFDAIENTIKNDYISAVGELVHPQNIIFASRVSNNRICIYLSSKDLVESFMNTHGGIKLNDSIIPARRLVSPAKRIILSNVSPSLPHEILEKELKQIGLQVVSPVRFIGAGIPKEGYKHIFNFRRHVYVVFQEHERLPDSLVIQFRGNAFRVFLTTDEIRCFQCKRIGHVASKCPSNNDNSVVVETVEASSVPLPDSPCPSSPEKEEERQVGSLDKNMDSLDTLPKRAEPSTPTDSEPTSLLIQEYSQGVNQIVAEGDVPYSEFKDIFIDRVEVIIRIFVNF